MGTNQTASVSVLLLLLTTAAGGVHSELERVDETTVAKSTALESPYREKALYNHGKIEERDRREQHKSRDMHRDSNTEGQSEEAQRGQGFLPAAAFSTVAGSVFCSSRQDVLSTPMFGAEAILLCPHKPPRNGGPGEGGPGTENPLFKVLSSMTAQDGSFYLSIKTSYRNVLDRCVVEISPTSVSNCELPPHSGRSISLSTTPFSANGDGGQVYTLDATFGEEARRSSLPCGQSCDNGKGTVAVSVQRKLLQTEVPVSFFPGGEHGKKLKTIISSVEAQKNLPDPSRTGKLNWLSRRLFQITVTIPPIPQIPAIPQIPPIPLIPPIPQIPPISPIPPTTPPTPTNPAPPPPSRPPPPPPPPPSSSSSVSSDASSASEP